MTIQQEKTTSIHPYMYAGIKYKNTFEAIVNVVLDKRKKTLEELSTKCRRRDLAETRHIIYYFCDKYKVGTQQMITDLFKQDHATLIHAKRTIANIILTDKMLAMELDVIESEIIKQLDL